MSCCEHKRTKGEFVLIINDWCIWIAQLFDLILYFLHLCAAAYLVTGFSLLLQLTRYGHLTWWNQIEWIYLVLFVSLLYSGGISYGNVHIDEELRKDLKMSISISVNFILHVICESVLYVQRYYSSIVEWWNPVPCFWENISYNLKSITLFRQRKNM